MNKLVSGEAAFGASHMPPNTYEAYVIDSLRLTVNQLKNAVDRPLNRKLLGFTISRNGAKLDVADQAIEKLKDRVRELTRRTRGTSIGAIVAELREFLLGWKAYFGIAEVLSPLRDIDKWVRRKLRCYLWKQWGSSGYCLATIRMPRSARGGPQDPGNSDGLMVGGAEPPVQPCEPGRFYLIIRILTIRSLSLS